MYCNICMKQIAVDEITYCKECGVPLHKSCANHCLECHSDMCDDCYVENRYRCSDCIVDDKTMRTIRRSYIKQYEDCPYSFYLQVVEGIEPPMSSYAELGILVHELIEEMQHGDKTVNQAKTELETKVMAWNIETEEDYSVIPLSLLQIGLHSLDVFERMRYDLNDNFKTEYKIEFSVDENLPTVNCTIDRLSFVDGNIHIHDWKTGKPMSGKKLVEDLQPPIYIYAVFKEYGIMPKTFTLHYLNAEKNITYKHTEGMMYEVQTSRKKYVLNVEEAIERTKTILSNIKKNKFEIIEDKEHLWRCSKMCWFHDSGMCSDFTDAAWKLANQQYEEGEAA